MAAISAHPELSCAGDERRSRCDRLQNIFSSSALVCHDRKVISWSLGAFQLR